MKFLTLASILGVTAFTSLVSAGCYGGGLKFSELTGPTVDSKIEHFCKHELSKVNDVGTSTSKCYSFDGNSLYMRLENILGKPLSEKTCKKYFSAQRTCSHGGKDIFENYEFKIDPKEGQCT